ncbi:LysE/ArgO family amino acid transporter [Xanthomonas codiaei]|uniref:Amino acid transporter n=1 Tax=Xanthomonas codiaei TaxID=56463 RepID=A0A2S7CKK0_9XANT|nr:LysE/ArgO family amino acid transporter [Xanthomonas codiaei]PPU62022.1 amino acid transporter [Xanthomonas codiaei]
MSIAPLISGFLSGAGLIVAIGAQNAFVLRQGVKRRHVAQVVALCALGDITLILLGVAGIGVLVQRYSGLLDVLRFGGAGFLLFYSLLAARRAWQGTPGLSESGRDQTGLARVMLTCAAFTFLNPHVYLDTMVLLGSLSTRYPGQLRWIFALGACLASVTWFTTLGFGARLLQPIFRNPTAWRVLDALIALFMAGLGVALLVRPL